MELNSYGLGAHPRDHGEISDDERQKFPPMNIIKDASGLEQMTVAMPRRKEQEFIDHTLLAPTYIRDSNNFIMDLIEHPVVFPKSVNAAPSNAVTDGADFSVKDTLVSELNFHNSIFQFVNKTAHESNEATDATLRVLSVQPVPVSLVRANSASNAYNGKHTPADDFMSLSGDFLGAGSSKTFCGAGAGNHEISDAPQPFPALTLLPAANVVGLEDTDVMHDGDIIYMRSNARKVLPHKKRISRKLKGDQHGMEPVAAAVSAVAAFPAPLEQHKLPAEERLPTMPNAMQYSCELCGHSAVTQLEFFAHLKRHYEPTTPDTILASMKTTLEALEPVKVCDHLCSTLTKKSGSDNVDQVFHDVQLNFEDFHSVNDSVRDVMQQPDDNDMKILNSNGIDKCINYVTQAQVTPLKDITPDEVEFSDTEDMLEGIRNVVDKMSIEDTCDELDLMAPNGMRATWFSVTDSLMNFKSRPFSDVSCAEPLSGMPSELESDGIPAQSKVPPLPSPGLKIVDPSKLMALPNDKAANDNKSTLKTIQAEDGTSFGASKSSLELLPATDESTADSAHMELDAGDSFVRQTRQKTSKSHLILRDNSYIDDYIFQQELEAADEDFVAPDETVAQLELGKKQFICSKCLRKFNSSNALKYHYRTHSGIRPHQCDVCKKSFFAQGALKSHMRTHTGEKPFECDHCPSKFRQWGDLKYHVISKHTEEKSHQCEFCGKAFSRKYSLVLHRRIHTCENNYKCDYCSKSFRASIYLQNHRKIHTGQKPYECNVCSKSFRVSGDLRRHMRIHQRTKSANIKTEEVGEDDVDQKKKPIQKDTKPN